MSTSLREKIKSIKPFSEQETALMLAQAGELMSEKIHSRMQRLINLHPKIPLFTLSISESLLWARYAKDTKQFLKLSLNYLTKGDEKIFEEIGDLAWRFGPEKLETVFRSWKILLSELEISKLLHLFSSKQLLIFQQEALNKALTLSKIGRLPQIGAWIFCGPFKILAAYRKEIWDDFELDEILMPLGFQVIRGFRFLKTIGYNIRVGLLNEEEPSLITGMGTVYIAQNFQKRFANLVQSRILHINSGLFKLGEETRRKRSGYIS